MGVVLLLALGLESAAVTLMCAGQFQVPDGLLREAVPEPRPGKGNLAHRTPVEPEMGVAFLAYEVAVAALEDLAGLAYFQADRTVQIVGQVFVFAGGHLARY